MYNRVRRLEDIEDGQSYVASNSRRFIPANYGRTGEAFFTDSHHGGAGRFTRIGGRRKRSGSSRSSTTSSSSTPGSGDGKIIRLG